MKRFYVVVLLLVYCVTAAPSFAQTRSKKRTPQKKTASSPQKKSPLPKVQELQVPFELYSLPDLERQRREAMEDIALTAKLLEETSAGARSSLNRLNLLSQQLLARKRAITILGHEVSAIDRKISAMAGEINLLDKDLVQVKNNYVKLLQNQLQEHRTAQYKMLLILSAENLSQSYRRMRYLREYSDWQKEEAGRIMKKQDDLMNRKVALEDAREEKQYLLTQRQQENKTLEDEENLQRKEVRELNRKQKDLQRQLLEKKHQADALNRQIDNLIAEDIKDSRKKVSGAAAAPDDSAAAASQTAATVRPGTNYVMTEAESILSKNFAGNRGKLPFPLTGNYAIVSDFGEQQHQELSYVKTNNNGIDIQTTAGVDACVIFNGVVTRVFVMPGYNNNVIVRHGDYLTVYSNLSQVYIKAGDEVATLQPIGKIFTDTENGNETILHFQIWKERTKLNPTAWIK
jgi:septal ring factor EnvC (AmiA/AmiB activator)